MYFFNSSLLLFFSGVSPVSQSPPKGRESGHRRKLTDDGQGTHTANRGGGGGGGGGGGQGSAQAVHAMHTICRRAVGDPERQPVVSTLHRRTVLGCASALLRSASSCSVPVVWSTDAFAALPLFLLPPAFSVPVHCTSLQRPFGGGQALPMRRTVRGRRKKRRSRRNEHGNRGAFSGSHARHWVGVKGLP
jgi:hypothetical protein